ncbi:TetR/AcrR family transcriptional regulator [Nonomuraea pusilla]|uniref:TetR/AcrR family transcriptional regulator n=1 Tax=Nonomuraea pusilla TaxID=46177 RepID=UPI00332944DB
MAAGRYHHGDLRTALLDAAEELIREKGADGWSLREASVRVGVSPSAAYHHFDSRDSLMAALHERLLVRLAERLSRDVGRAPEGPPRVIAYGRSYVRWAVEEPAVAGLAGGGRRAAAVSPHPHDVLAAELDRLVEGGHLPAAVRPGAEFVVWAAVHGLARLVADGHMRFDGAEDVDRQAERVTLAVLNGLALEQTGDGAWPVARSPHTESLARARTAPGSAPASPRG